MLTMTNKVGHALAIGFSYTLLDLIGFRAGGENSAEVLDHLRDVYVWPPIIISLAVAWIMMRYPIDEAQQKLNREILDGRLTQVAAEALADRTMESDVPPVSLSGGAQKSKPAE